MFYLKKIFSSAMVVLVLLTTGCAAFRSNIEGKFEQEPEKNYGAKGVSVCFVFSHLRQTRGYDAIPKLDSDRQRIWGFDDFFQDALNEFSNVNEYATFTNYASDVNDPERRTVKKDLMSKHDYVMKLKFMREKSFTTHALGSIFTGLSLTLLPVPYHYEYSVDVELFDSNNQLLFHSNRNTTLTKWVQTFLIFAYPFHPEKRKKEEIYVDFMHDIFKEIESERILK